MPTIDYTDIGDVLNHEIVQGTIVSIDPLTDTCTVNAGGTIFTALIFYHCTAGAVKRLSGAIKGGAGGFEVGDSVIVLRKFDNSKILVIGHVGGIHRCADEVIKDYYAFYLDGDLKIANCGYVSDLSVVETKGYGDVNAINFTTPVTFHLKKFRHNVPSNGVVVTRDLYFIATSLYIDPAPFIGWTNFATANPAFALVTNNSDSKIAITPQVLIDLNTINNDVNTTHSYVSDPLGSDNWKILGVGESGDCEDFALTKAKALLDLGYPASAIHVEAGLIDGSSIGHAWLVVQTTGGDFALDTSSASIVENFTLKPTPITEYTGRRRQIGSNWAFISSFGWMLSSQNASMPWTLWYILDPLLNVIYPLYSGVVIYPPFSYVRTDPSILSGPSINFSTDNNEIHVAINGLIQTFKLNENSLDLVSWSNYASGGFVGRDGLIVEPLGLVGNQDTMIGLVGTVDLWFTWYYVDSWVPAKIGSFKIMNRIEVTSKDGYYEYVYRYLTGTISETIAPSGYMWPQEG